MAANVLNSLQAVQMSVLVVRAFVRMRQVMAAHKELAAKLTELERKVAGHAGPPNRIRGEAWRNRQIERTVQMKQDRGEKESVVPYAPVDGLMRMER
jgi:hypothetical protein